MKNSNFLLLLVYLLIPLFSLAQEGDVEESTLAVSSTPFRKLEPIGVSSTIPRQFIKVQKNRIVDKKRNLDKFWEKLLGKEQVVRVVHIGDSHVRGHFFPYETRLKLESSFGGEATRPIPVDYKTSGIAIETGKPGLAYHILGINGATASNFLEPKYLNTLDSLKPDLIILSLGTNEAHTLSYNSTAHRRELIALLDRLEKAHPQAAILLTSPPGAYFSFRRRRKKVNPNTAKVVATQRKISEERGYAYWDLYHIAGGSAACRNWLSIGAFQKDKKHFTHQGYAVQGRMLYEALIKSYNDYVRVQSANR